MHQAQDNGLIDFAESLSLNAVKTQVSYWV
jgi:hypothetical protein